KRRDQARGTGSLDNPRIDAVDLCGEANAPVGEEVLDAAGKRQLGVEFGSLECAARPRIFLDDRERQQKESLAPVEGSCHVSFQLMNDRGELIGRLRVDFCRVSLADV